MKFLRQAVTSINNQVMTSRERRGVTSQVQISSLELSSLALTSMYDVSQELASSGTSLYLPGDCLLLEDVLDVLTDKVRDFGLDVSWRYGVDAGKACPFNSDGFACTKSAILC
jgi:hypothetical protein